MLTEQHGDNIDAEIKQNSKWALEIVDTMQSNHYKTLSIETRHGIHEALLKALTLIQIPL